MYSAPVFRCPSFACLDPYHTLPFPSFHDEDEASPTEQLEPKSKEDHSGGPEPRAVPRNVSQLGA